MSAHFLRSILVVAGAYAFAEWLAGMLMVAEAAIGLEYSGAGRLGELWMNVRITAPRAFAAACGTALLWPALGPASARRWMWTLAGLFAVSGLLSRQFHPVPGVIPDPVSRAMDIAVYCLLPALGCVAGAWILGRVAPAAGATLPADSPVTPAHRQSRALWIAWSIVTVVAGAGAGMWIASSVQFQQMSGWTVAAVDSARRSEYAFFQYREADYDEARVALEQFAAYLEGLKPASGEWQPGDAPLTDEKGLAFEKMLTYGRLAVRAERANQVDAARSYWARAEQNAIALKWEAPARQRIRDAVLRLDASPITSPSPPR